MKKKCAWLIFLLFFAGACNSGKGENSASSGALPAKAGGDERVVTFAADEWYPFNGKAGDNPPGYVIELLREIFAPAGYRVQYHTVPWARAVRASREGVYDAVIGACREEAPGFVFPSRSQGQVSDLFYTSLHSRWYYTNIKSLQAISLGVIRDYSYNDSIDSYISNNAGNNRLLIMHGEDPLDGLLRALDRGVIHAFLTQPVILKAYLKRKGRSDLLAKLRMAGTASSAADIFVAFSPKNKARSQKLAQILDRGMESLRRSGRLQAILARYGLQDWVKR